MTSSTSPTTSLARRYVARGWWSLTLLLPSAMAAFLVGESVPGALGVDEGHGEPPPLGVMILALGAATIVLALPLLMTARFSRIAAQSGARGAWSPLIVGGTIVALFVGINVVSGILILAIR